MKPENIFRTTLALLACALQLTLNAAPQKAGDKAPEFELKTLEDRSLHLSDLTASGRVVLIILRGWPGYQCPLCNRQVQDYVASAAEFAKVKTRVVMVYPGPADALKAHAAEFLKDKQWPKDFIYLTDPDYSLVNAYGLRWDVPGETAYPSTFVLDRKGVIRFAKISSTHGDRTKAAEILEQLKALEPN